MAETLSYEFDDNFYGELVTAFAKSYHRDEQVPDPNDPDKKIPNPEDKEEHLHRQVWDYMMGVWEGASLQAVETFREETLKKLHERKPKRKEKKVK